MLTALLIGLRVGVAVISLDVTIHTYLYLKEQIAELPEGRFTMKSLVSHFTD